MFNAMSMRGEVIPKLNFTVRDGVPETRVKSRAHQSFAKDANINNIMRKYQKTGLLVEPGTVQRYRQASFGDFSDLKDLPTHLNHIREANLNFMALPALTREKFGNDVSQLLRFIDDPANLVESIDLGLLPESLRPKMEDPKTEPKPAGTAGAGTAT